MISRSPQNDTCSPQVVDIDDESSDSDSDFITFSQYPAGPYKVGIHNVTLTVVDDNNVTDYCKTTVTMTNQSPEVEPLDHAIVLLMGHLEPPWTMGCCL